jgi:hypothetical protein
MKHAILIIISLLLSSFLYAQKKGYEEIQIGVSLDSIKKLHHYKISEDLTANNTYVVAGDSLRIFLTDIERLEILVSDKNIIKRVTAYTKKKFFSDYNDWLSDLKFILLVINGDVNKLNSSAVARESEKNFVLAWTFVNTKTAILLSAAKVNRDATNFVCNYEITWVEDTQNLADAKF